MILKRLKDETRSSHQATEKQLDLFNRMLTKQEYAWLLGRFWGFYVPIESKIHRVVGMEELTLNLSARQKKTLLWIDLTSLDWNEPTIQALPLCDDLPVLDSIPQALGCLYVLEARRTDHFSTFARAVRYHTRQWGAILFQLWACRRIDVESVL